MRDENSRDRSGWGTYLFGVWVALTVFCLAPPWFWKVTACGPPSDPCRETLCILWTMSLPAVVGTVIEFVVKYRRGDYAPIPRDCGAQSERQTRSEHTK